MIHSRLARVVLALVVVLVLATAAAAQSVNPPARSVGDTWTRSHGLVITVVTVDESGSIESGYLQDCPTCLSHFDKSWNFKGIITDAGGKSVDVTQLRGAFTGPGWRFYDWPLEVKKSWDFSGQGFFRAQPTKYDVSAAVKGYEDVKTKAGTFKAFKIQYDWETRNRFQGTSRWTVTNWYAPEVRSVVKSTTTSPGGQDWELVSYNLK